MTDNEIRHLAMFIYLMGMFIGFIYGRKVVPKE